MIVNETTSHKRTNDTENNYYTMLYVTVRPSTMSLPYRIVCYKRHGKDFTIL